ncbi:MAG TPA: hypothetical protein VGF76_04975 [Polyangiaceae bacterium]|jgi:hypothetical protein
MSRLRRFPLFALLLCLSGAALGACQALAGIEDRVYVASGGAGGAALGEAGAAGADAGPSAQCQDYCTRIMALCTKPNEAYADISTCLGICALIPPGSAIEKTGNSLVCRLNQLAIQESPSAEPSSLAEACARSGPGGNGACGTDCESYCQLYKAACQADQPNLTSEQYDQDTCVSKCQGLSDPGTFDTDLNYTGDTLQCRLVHTSAATVDPATHCVHAQLQAQGQAIPPGPCTDDPKSAPDCDSFCTLEMAECQGPDQIYADTPQCLAVCGALPLGTIGDTSQNTVGCRKYHSYNAMLDPDTHCSHTGPGGDGHCGDMATGNCESYCILAEAACGATVPGVSPTATFETTYLNSAGCQKACAKLPGAAHDSGYSLDAKGNNVQCLLLHASKALSTPADDCAAALGAAPCK